MDMSLPMYNDRLDTPLPDKPYKDVLSDAEESLKQKEKGHWSQLTNEEKIACKILLFLIQKGFHFSSSGQNEPKKAIQQIINISNTSQM